MPQGTPAFLAVHDLCRRDPRLHLQATGGSRTRNGARCECGGHHLRDDDAPPAAASPAVAWWRTDSGPDDASGQMSRITPATSFRTSRETTSPQSSSNPITPSLQRAMPDTMAMILSDAPVDAALESHLTALIQHRGNDLYRLTTDLDRRLTMLSASPDALAAILSAAADISGRGVLLTDPQGLPIFSVGCGPPNYTDELARQAVRSRGKTLIVSGPDGDARLICPVRTAEGVRGYLSLVGGRNAFRETDRLIAERTAVACIFALMRMGQTTIGDPATRPHTGRNRAVAARVAPGAAGNGVRRARGVPRTGAGPVTRGVRPARGAATGCGIAWGCATGARKRRCRVATARLHHGTPGDRGNCRAAASAGRRAGAEKSGRDRAAARGRAGD